jgi:myo-inositol-1(or 4)-monophosphatase
LADVTDADLASLLALAVDVAHEAGRVLLAHRGQVLDTQMKSSATDPVTAADHASERLITSRLLASRPDDGMLGEEAADDRRGTTGVRWVVDPLDATVNFTYGLPHWCVSIAAEDEHGPLVGVVHDPVRAETFRASRGGGAWLEEGSLAVTTSDALGRMLVATGFAYDPAVRVDQGRLAADLLAHARDIRRGGSAALDLAYLAAGRVDAYYEFGLAPWDWAAGRLLVTEAGGVVSEHRSVLGGQERTGIVAGGRAAHDLLVAWWQQTEGT